MDLAWRSQYVGVLEMQYDGVQFYFIDNEYYFAGPKPYGNIYQDIEKFAFFQRLRFLHFRSSVSSRISYIVMTGRQDLFRCF